MLKEIIKKFSRKEEIKPEIEVKTVDVKPDSPIGRWARKYNK